MIIYGKAIFVEKHRIEFHNFKEIEKYHVWSFLLGVPMKLSEFHKP